MAAKPAKKKVYVMKYRHAPSWQKDPEKVYKVSRVIGGTDPNPGDWLAKSEVDALIDAGVEVVVDAMK